jgi:hypothetical protein
VQESSDPQQATGVEPTPGAETTQPLVPAMPAAPPPTSPEPAAAAPVAARRPQGRTVGIVALAGAALVAVLAVGYALGSGTTPDSSAPAGAASSPAQPAGAQPADVSAAWTSPDGKTKATLDASGGMMGLRRGAANITITDIQGTKLSLTTADGWTRTIDAAGATITKGGATAKVSDLTKGDQIVFRETRNADGTYTVTAITVIQPSVAGTVKSVSGSTVTVTTFDGGSAKVALTSSTTYQLGRQKATADAVVPGARIAATGTLGSDGTLTASAVQIQPAMVAGTVKSTATDSLTLTQRDGSTVVVKVSSSTTYRVGGLKSPTLTDIKVGDVATASGTKNADGSLSASVVAARAPGQFGGPGNDGMGGWGFPGGGRGGFGPGMGGGGFPGSPGAPAQQPANGANG